MFKKLREDLVLAISGYISKINIVGFGLVE